MYVQYNFVLKISTFIANKNILFNTVDRYGIRL